MAIFCSELTTRISIACATDGTEEAELNFWLSPLPPPPPSNTHTCVPGRNYWPVKNAIVDLPIILNENSKPISGNS